MISRLERLLLFLLVLLFPSQLAFHFWPPFSLMGHIRIDYLSPSIYLTDLLIVPLLLLDYFKTKKNLTAIPYSLLLLIITNLLFSLSPLFTLYKYLRLFVYFCLYKYLSHHKQDFLSTWRTALPLTLFWVSALAIFQFLSQQSLGGFWYWLGERSFSLITPQIAKISLGNLGIFLRAYSTFSHPNALAGFLSIGLLLIIQLNGQRAFPKPWLVSVFVLIITALLSTFSRTGLLITILIIMSYLIVQKNLLLFFVCLLSPLLLFLPFIGSPESATERFWLMTKSFSLIKTHPIFGLGLGNFPLTYQFSVYHNNSLNYQPTHNIFVLLACELGVILFLAVLLILAKWAKHYWFSANLVLKLALIDILLLGLFDHYWITSNQNILLLIFVAVLFKVRSSDKNYE